MILRAPISSLVDLVEGLVEVMQLGLCITGRLTDHQHAFQRRRFGDSGKKYAPQVTARDQDGGSAVVEDVGELGGFSLRVDEHEDRIGQQRAVKRHRALPGIVEKNHHPVATAHPDLC